MVPINSSTSANSKPNIYLIWGGNGWIANHLAQLLKHQLEQEESENPGQESPQVHTTTVRMEDRAAVIDLLDSLAPTHVFNCAGCTGRPNVDWCEDNKEATIRSNAIGTLNLADCCWLRGVHCTVFATGCIYTYDKTHPIGGPGYTEDEPANFSDSFYSLTKSKVEDMLKFYTNTLILRLRMPVSDDLHPRSFVTKITAYKHVVDVPNSNTILHDLLPCAVLLAQARESGIYNFTNPGAISHNEVLALFKRIVRPGFVWENFSLEEQAKILKAGRSNCELDSSKLVDKMREFGVVVPEVHEAYEKCFERMVKNGIV